MRVFVTGATGFVGSAVVKELLTAGHQVLGLARSEKSAQSLQTAGAEVHRGEVNDFTAIKKAAASCDGVIHTAFNHDFSKFKENCEADRLVVLALGEALLGTDKPLLITSGTALVNPGHLALETDKTKLSSAMNPRVATEEAIDTIAAKGVRAAGVRLSPSVHDDGDKGFIPMLIGMARERGVSAYVGEGQNRWNAVHRLDAARLYRLALEKNAAPGTRWHAAGEEAVPFKIIAEVIGKHLGCPVVSKTPAEAAAHFTWFAHFAALDCPTSSKISRELLGWNPKHKGLIEDMEGGKYFSK